MVTNKKGFTLIELLVVIAIIGTLSGIVLVSLTGAREKARDAVRKSDLRQVLSAQEMYYLENGAYLQAAAATDGTPAIGSFLGTLHDPQCPDGNCVSGATDYEWIANDASGCDDGERFCAYGTLEATSTAWFAVSHKGTRVVNTEPSALGDADAQCDCW